MAVSLHLSPHLGSLNIWDWLKRLESGAIEGFLQSCGWPLGQDALKSGIAGFVNGCTYIWPFDIARSMVPGFCKGMYLERAPGEQAFQDTKVEAPRVPLT